MLLQGQDQDGLHSMLPLHQATRKGQVLMNDTPRGRRGCWGCFHSVRFWQEPCVRSKGVETVKCPVFSGSYRMRELPQPGGPAPSRACSHRTRGEPRWNKPGQPGRLPEPLLHSFCPHSYLRNAASCLASESNIFKFEEIPAFFSSFVIVVT